MEYLLSALHALIGWQGRNHYLYITNKAWDLDGSQNAQVHIPIWCRSWYENHVDPYSNFPTTYETLDEILCLLRRQRRSCTSQNKHTSTSLLNEPQKAI